MFGKSQRVAVHQLRVSLLAGHDPATSHSQNSVKQQCSPHCPAESYLDGNWVQRAPTAQRDMAYMVLPVPLMTRCRIIAVTSHSPLSLYLGVKAVWTCRHDVPPDLRAAPRATFAVTAIRLQSLTPSSRRFLPGGGGARPNPATRSLAPLEHCRTGTAGLARLAPRRTVRGLWGYAPACCGRLCQSVPSSTLAVRAFTSRRTVHRHATRPRYGASTPRLKPVAAICGKERSRLSLGTSLALPVPGCKPVKPSRGDAESATSPFGSGRPVRPWLVANPGEGTATPWA